MDRWAMETGNFTDRWTMEAGHITDGRTMEAGHMGVDERCGHMT